MGQEWGGWERVERGGRGWRGEKRGGKSSGGGTEIRSGSLRERLRSVHMRRSKIGGAKAPPSGSAALGEKGGREKQWKAKGGRGSERQN